MIQGAQVRMSNIGTMRPIANSEHNASPPLDARITYSLSLFSQKHIHHLVHHAETAVIASGVLGDAFGLPPEIHQSPSRRQ